MSHGQKLERNTSFFKATPGSLGPQAAAGLWVCPHPAAGHGHPQAMPRWQQFSLKLVSVTKGPVKINSQALKCLHTYCREKKKKGWVIFTGYSFSGRASSSMQPVKGKGPGGCSCYLWNETHSIQVCVQIAFPNVPPEIFSSVVTVQEDL